MRLGYACTNKTLGYPVHSLRLATLEAKGLSYLQELVDENMRILMEILRWNREHDIFMFRLSSDLVPLGSHEAVDITQLSFPSASDFAPLIAGMRLWMHPGQFTLPSASGTIWDKSVKDLVYHCFMLDTMGIDGEIILHGGGVYGDRPATAARIVENILSLPIEVRHRLRLENDERSWAVEQLLPICEATSVPLIVDNLHHSIYNSGPLANLPWQRVLDTWHGRLPKLHYSEQNPMKRPGAHSEYATTATFLEFQASIHLPDYDVMLECKAKEVALLKLRQELAERELGVL